MQRGAISLCCCWPWCLAHAADLLRWAQHLVPCGLPTVSNVCTALPPEQGMALRAPAKPGSQLTSVASMRGELHARV